MARNQNTFAKRQREIAKKRKAAEKRERRWAKKEQKANPEGIEAPLEILTEEDAFEALAAKRDDREAKKATEDSAAGE